MCHTSLEISLAACQALPETDTRALVENGKRILRTLDRATVRLAEAKCCLIPFGMQVAVLLFRHRSLATTPEWIGSDPVNDLTRLYRIDSLPALGLANGRLFLARIDSTVPAGEHGAQAARVKQGDAR